MKTNPFLLTDFYKVGHKFQYPEGTEEVYSNLTPRKSLMRTTQHMVFFGLQYFIKKFLVEYFRENFFDRPKKEVMDEYKRLIKGALGVDLPSYDHIESLHDLGYLPIRIKALPEGSRVPMRVPCLTIVNTLPKYFWLTNFLETLMSATIWQGCTSATIANEYRKIFNKYGNKTGMPQEFVQWQGHDFSFRGMSSLESAVISGMGHLLSFTGTDTIPAIVGLEQHYGADVLKELIGGSVFATEHSVQCAGGEGDERATIKRLITEVYPSGIISIVSDTWDLWKVLEIYLPSLKDEILARPGDLSKVVVRPDSGDPYKIMCGDENSSTVCVRKGVVELLWDHFGGHVNDQGYKVLNPKVGAIYGDSITLDRADAICSGLEAKGFASQTVFGIGSYTYQYNTRDTFGTAIKSTNVVINGVSKPIFKEPITGDGTKNSAKGYLKVSLQNGEYILEEDVSVEQERQGELRTVYEDGEIIEETTLADIRYRLQESRGALV